MISTVEIVPDRRLAIDFGLSPKALRFARFYAANPQWGVTLCAKRAGYSDRSRGAHVRGCELQRDPRVNRAIVHFSSLELVEAQALATKRLRLLADGDNFLSWRDCEMIKNLATDLAQLARRADRIEKVYAASLGKAA